MRFVVVDAARKISDTAGNNSEKFGTAVARSGFVVN